MNTITEFNPVNTIRFVVPNVFETMLALSAQPTNPHDAPAQADRVGGTIGIAGDNVTGAIYVHLPAPLAQLLVNAMLGNPAEQTVADNDINDVVGELTNMIGGGFKSALCDAGRPCAMSTPSIIRGAYDIETPEGLRVHAIPFQCQGLPLTVELHLKLD